VRNQGGGGGTMKNWDETPVVGGLMKISLISDLALPDPLINSSWKYLRDKDQMNLQRIKMRAQMHYGHKNLNQNYNPEKKYSELWGKIAAAGSSRGSMGVA